MRAFGYEPAHIHDFRHTFGSMLASQGVDLVTIKSLMGHSDIKTTMIYLHYSPSHMEDAIEKLPL
jgi:site-specific recombinase XerD